MAHVDVTAMDAAQMRELMAKQGIEITGFGKMTLDRKRKALQERVAAPVSGRKPSRAKANGKAGKETAAPSREIRSFVDVVRDIEQILTEEQAVTAVTDICDEGELAMFRLGGVLVRMKEQGWYGDGASDFYAFVENLSGLGKRDVQYRMKVYKDLCDLNIPWDKVDGLGWTKLRLISPILNEENVDRVIADVKDLSTRETEQYVQNIKPGSEKDDDGDTGHTVILKFKIAKDQEGRIRSALKKAMKDGKTDSEALALEYIAADFLAGGTVPAPDVKAMMLQLKMASRKPREVFEDVYRAMTDVFPDYVEPLE